MVSLRKRSFVDGIKVAHGMQVTRGNLLCDGFVIPCSFSPLRGAHTWQYFGPETLLVHWQRCHKNCYESNKKELAGQRTRSATFLGLATFLARNIATCAPRLNCNYWVRYGSQKYVKGSNARFQILFRPWTRVQLNFLLSLGEVKSLIQLQNI